MWETLRRLEADATRISAPTDTPETPSRKKRISNAHKLVKRVKAALEEGRIEDDIKGVTLDKVISKSSTKQTMLARVCYAAVF
jgi:ubiquitin carboxyl-terminal hydrolase 1